MTLSIELMKLRRTGYIPAFLAGGILASAFPLANMIFRAEIFTGLPGNPYGILMRANWQMMGMINVLISVCGACIMYHTEYSDNGAQKMDVLPVRAEYLFLWKFLITVFALAIVTVIEQITIFGCALYWYPGYETAVSDFIKGAVFQWAIVFPTVMLMLLISSACNNMWISLGIGVILLFIMSILPEDNFILNLFPFCSPFQTFEEVSQNGRIPLFLSICSSETVLFGAGEELYQKIRRAVQ